jgi:hypothetical protein
MADDAHTAMAARRRELMDGALEAVERVSLATRHDLERLVVVIAASIADRHGKLLRFVSIARCTAFGGGGSDWFGLNVHFPSPVSHSHSVLMRCR